MGRGVAGRKSNSGLLLVKEFKGSILNLPIVCLKGLRVLTSEIKFLYFDFSLALKEH